MIKFSFGKAKVCVPLVDDLEKLNLDPKVFDEVQEIIDLVGKTEGEKSGALLKKILPKVPKVAPSLIMAVMPICITPFPKNAKPNIFDLIKFIKALSEEEEIRDFFISLEKEELPEEVKPS